MLSRDEAIEKIKKLKTKSNIQEVARRAKQIYGDDVVLYISDRKNKKYMILEPKTEKWMHFGDIRYEDFTYHGDKNRRERFQIRNHKWSKEPKYSPSYMAYYLLW
jgi:hypothetical protein